MDVLLDTGTGRRAVICLLLLHLLVMKAAADCPQPQGGENIVLNRAALLLNNFPNGTEVTLECARTFVRESGSEIITCIDGSWTEPNLTCQIKDCGTPPVGDYMRYGIIANTLYGAQILVICDRGRKVYGTMYKTCDMNGWTGAHITCDIITCVKPGNVTNGRSLWGHEGRPMYGESVDYLCNAGYVLVGRESLVCDLSGEYDGRPPTCEGGEDIYGTEDDTITSATSTTSPSLQGVQDGTTHAKKDSGYMPVIVSVIGVLLVVCLAGIAVHTLFLRKKGASNEHTY